jgi:hypothetical protein
MFLTQRKEAVLMSFDPRIKQHENQVHYVIIPYDNGRVELLMDKINAASNYRDKLLKQLNG